MTKECCGGFISKITFNNSEYIELSPDDIVLFVGPNNAGKSQALRDIYSISGDKGKGIVIINAPIQKYTSPLKCVLDRLSYGTEAHGEKRYTVLNNHYSYGPNTDKYYQNLNHHWVYRDLFVSNLDTSARLSICFPAASIPRNAARDNPIQYAAFDRNYRKWLSDNFYKAFGSQLIPNTSHGSNIPLCIGNPVKLTAEYEDEQSRQEAYASILDKYKQVQDQGDGIKSFTGILLYLMLDHYCTFLIDEPESFLHPPQARIMGQIIGGTLNNNQQAFISTHSDEIIKGLLETCPQRLKIIRITRDGDINHFSVLKNDKIEEVWRDPLLKHSNIMTGLFHKTVVLCESDSDCQMYSIIDSHLKQNEGKYSETLFLHCGGKQRMHKIITALQTLGVNVKVIADIDVLNDEAVIKGIAEAIGLSWENLSKDYKTFVANLHSSNETIKRGTAATLITSILNSSKDQLLSCKEINAIKDAVKVESKWTEIKKSGIAAIPAGDATSAFQRINQALQANGLFVVPVGELECFIKEVGGHGPDWVNSVLERYPDLNDHVYDSIKTFLDSIGIR